MALEIEHKFLVRSNDWRVGADEGQRICQGYIAGGERVSVRVRIAADEAWLSIKHAQSLVVRREYEYRVPLADAEEMLEHVCEAARIEKTRYRVPVARHVFEVDVFHGDNDGLIVAEIELEHEGEAFERPSWLGDDVSHDTRYLNHCLVKHPWSRWGAPQGSQRQSVRGAEHD